ncbi:hypothetical protein BJ986_001610 [Phycicoccus badiiscoriae]|uniref:Uncharacterized protein n=1 Tax=Pedococcus badiiscoriae TaxID=642776 RepID=A0A852WD76_9MICO|nr:hypothetical protein [Pedococcus badiiscoriae]NYG07123.1 hypothetical protein [Pedococcus badiiscoriae]
MRQIPESAWLALPQPFLAREAFAAGLTSTSIAGAVRRRQVISVAASLYAVREPWIALSPPRLHLAMARAASVSVPGGVVSHLSAALVRGLPYPLGPLGPVSLTLPASDSTASRGDWRRLLDGAMPDEHVMRASGLPVTNPARTVIDCFRQLRPRDALAVADAALRQGLTGLEALEEMRAFQTRWPGITRADIGMARVDHRRESWLESASAATAHALGFPIPMSHVWIHRLDGRLIGRVDFLWPSAGVVGEADGRGKYLGSYSEDEWDAEEAAAHMVAERDRERELESVGFAVARWGTGAVLDGGSGLAQVLRETRGRAHPSRIRCLWRQDLGDDLRLWNPASMGTLPGHGNGPHAA